MLGLMYGLILFMLGGLLLLSWRHEQTIDRIEQTQLKQISTASNIVTVHNATVDRYDERLDEKDDEIKMIISRLGQIVADIAELNNEHISDHRDLVDIRMRYINYRTPVQPNGGVGWAPEFPTQEEE